ncbi:MAG: hypothetical protein VCA37_15220 [Roseibacillus sp.]
MVRVPAVVVFSWIACLPVGADSLKALDGSAYEGRLEFGRGDSLRIAQAGGESVSVPLSKVEVARNFGPTAVPPKPWIMNGAGVLTVNGSFIARPWKSVDDKKVTFESETDQLLLTTQNTAAIFFQPLTSKEAGFLDFARLGVLLRNGDFMEGTFRSCGNGSVTIQSLLLGERTFSTTKEAMAVFLKAPIAIGISIYSVHTSDGSCFQPRSLQIGEGGVILNGSPFRQYRISKDQPFEIVQERVPTILALFKERWEALGNDKTQAVVVKNGVPLPLGNDAEMQAIIKARGAVEEVIRDRTNALNNARQEWQSRQGFWSQKNQIANRARADVNRTRGQARSKSQQAAGLERSLSQASRDLDDKLKRAKAAKESLERDRAELGRIRDNPDAKRSLESKVKNADRARQNADRAVRQSKSNHSRYLGRLKSAQNAQRSAADLAKKMVEKEVKMRRDAEEATRDRDKARRAFDQAAANLKEVSQ